MRRGKSLLEALGILMLVGCFSDTGLPEERVVQGVAPIPKIIYRSGRIVVYTTVPWERLVDPEIFEGFRPGMTFEDAEKECGPPNKKGKGLRGPYYLYTRPQGELELSFEEIGSGATGAVFSSWRLRAFPGREAADRMLKPMLKQRVWLPSHGRTELVIMNPAGDMPSLEIVLEGARISSMTWIS